MARIRDGRFTLVAACAIAAVALAVSACGRKTPVRPPELVVPNSVQRLDVNNTDRGIELTWDRPTRYADGSQMLDLAGFRIERSRPCCGFVAYKEIEVDDRHRFRRTPRFRWVDERVEPGEVYTYRITAHTLDGYASAPTESESITRARPIPAE